jgi:hypothetical protein
MFGGDCLGQSISGKTANASSAAMSSGPLTNGVGDELLSMARISIVTKEILREGDISLLI